VLGDSTADWALVAAGGKGGRGNIIHFTTSTWQVS
jgi:GTPase involved in cell partitioning and DNA repair